MRKNMRRVFPEVALERLLEALEVEIIEASDDDILDAARDLGMNPAMRGSAAFLGLKGPALPQWEAFFAAVEPERLRLLESLRERIRMNADASPDTPQRRIGRDRKDRRDH
jgi:hypothetical protein